jgi:hypothetical protein
LNQGDVHAVIEYNPGVPLWIVFTNATLLKVIDPIASNPDENAVRLGHRKANRGQPWSQTNESLMAKALGARALTDGEISTRIDLAVAKAANVKIDKQTSDFFSAFAVAFAITHPLRVLAVPFECGRSAGLLRQLDAFRVDVGMTVGQVDHTYGEATYTEHWDDDMSVRSYGNAEAPAAIDKSLYSRVAVVFKGETAV